MKQTEKAYHVALGERMRQSRIQCGFSQNHMGEILGVTFQQVQKYEKGMNRVSPYRLILWGEKTETNILDLLNIGEKKPLTEKKSRKVDVSFVREFKELPSPIAKKMNELMRVINEAGTNKEIIA